jgi:hypothetical protein
MGHACSGFAFSEERVMRPRGRILSLVMRLGQRFESARRLLNYPASFAKSQELPEQTIEEWQ